MQNTNNIKNIKVTFVPYLYDEEEPYTGDVVLNYGNDIDEARQLYLINEGVTDNCNAFDRAVDEVYEAIHGEEFTDGSGGGDDIHHVAVKSITGEINGDTFRLYNGETGEAHRYLKPHLTPSAEEFYRTA